jgi:hypothetical protein
MDKQQSFGQKYELEAGAKIREIALDEERRTLLEVFSLILFSLL